MKAERVISRLAILFLTASVTVNAFADVGSDSLYETVPPEYTWTSPEKFSILTTNAIRLAVAASDSGSGIDKVLFYASYYDYTGQIVDRQKLGEVYEPPYEFLWNCSHIPDQGIQILRIYCDVIDKAGNVTSLPSGDGATSEMTFVLDRNPRLNSQTLRSGRTGRDIVIDGDLNEWAPSDSIQFSNNDNSIAVYSAWNDEYLFFGFNVDDKSVISRFGPGSSDIRGMPQEDIVEVYLDLKHDHAQIRTEPHISYLMSAAGMVFKRTQVFDGVSLKRTMDTDVEAAISIAGTLNEEEDIDCGYCGELAIRWDDIGVDPAAIENMGLEIWTDDKDYLNGGFFYAGWSTSAGCLNNPSEWGNIVFTGKRKQASLWIIIPVIVLLVSAAGIVLAFLWKKQNEVPSAAAEKEDDYITISKRFMEQNYSDETLSRAKIAASVNLTPSYFGKYFSDKTGMNVTEYLKILRIGKAKKLLIETDKNIAEIAFEVGFSSQSYFGRSFKKYEKMTPKKFRSTHSSAENDPILQKKPQSYKT